MPGHRPDHACMPPRTAHTRTLCLSLSLSVSLEKAAEVNLVGCQFGPKDAALWKKTGQMFLELGLGGRRPDEFLLKAQYCFGRAIKLDGKDVEAVADRAHVWSVWGKAEKAIYGYEQALRLAPPQPEVFLLRLAEECLRTFVFVESFASLLLRWGVYVWKEERRGAARQAHASPTHSLILGPLHTLRAAMLA